MFLGTWRTRRWLEVVSIDLQLIAGLVQEKRINYVVCFDFSKAFVAVSQNILMDKLLKHDPEKLTVRWKESWLNIWGLWSAPQSQDRVQPLKPHVFQLGIGIHGIHWGTLLANTSLMVCIMGSEFSDNKKPGGWLSHQISGHHSEGPGQAQEVGWQALINATKANAKTCPWGGVMPFQKPLCNKRLGSPGE